MATNYPDCKTQASEVHTSSTQTGPSQTYEINTMTAFAKWMESHGGQPSPAAQTKLAKELCDQALSSGGEKEPTLRRRAEDRQNRGTDSDFPLVSWKGITAHWFHHVFMKTRELQTFRSFGCQMWFVRNRCITEMLRRRGVTSNGAIIDHISRLSDQPAGPSGTHHPGTAPGTSDDNSDDGGSDDAACFISYTGEMTLAEFSALLENKSLASKRLWIDLICVCQFSWTERGDEDMKRFKEGFLYKLRDQIGSIGTTALLVSRWDDIMAVLGKIWVLWEIFATVDGKSSLDVLFTETEDIRFIENVVRADGGLEEIYDTVSRVDANKASSFVPEDRTLIHGLMAETDGVFNVNKSVLKCLQNWFLTKAEAFYKTMEQQGEDVDEYRGILISLYIRSGQVETAVQLGREKVASVERKYGDTDKRTLVAMTQLAITLSDDGTPSVMAEAEALLKDVLAKVDAVGEQDPSISVYTHRLLASLLRQQRRNDEAESHLHTALSILQQAGGEGHPNACSIEEDLLELLAEREALPEDEVFQFRRVDELRGRLGAKHPDTLEAMSALANYLETEDRLPEAEPLYREVARTMTEQLGVENELRLTAVKALASVAQRDERFDAADALFREAFEIERRTLGDAHATTLETMDELCTVLNGRGCEEEADELSARCLALSESGLGRDHADTLTFANNRAYLLFGQGRGQEAELLMREVVERHTSVLGECHADTFRVMANLGYMLAQLGKWDEGMSLVDEAVRGATTCAEIDEGMVAHVRNIQGALRHMQ